MTKSLFKTLLGMGLFVFFTLPQVGGAGFAILFILVWWIYTLIDGILLRKKPKIWLIKLLCWLMTFGVVYAIHHVYNQNARAYANQVLAELNQFYQKDGHYPSSKTWQKTHTQCAYHLYYICLDDCVKNQSKPILLYSSSLSVFDRYQYDFEKQIWEHRPD